MKTDIGIFLFLEAEFYMEDFDMEDTDLAGETIRECAAGLAGYLGDVADLADILQRDGWCLYIDKCNLVGTHPDVKTAEDAMNRLIGLNVLDGDLIDIGEWDDNGTRLNG
jgi:hypothetical protein